MKNLKIFSLVFFFSAFVTVCFADDQLITTPIKVHVESPGNLKYQIGKTKAKLITNLILTGDLNSDDIDYLRYMAGYEGGNLQYLDLSDANMVNGGYTNFKECKFLVVKLPKSIKKISKEAFRRCHNLEQVVIPDGVKIIGESAFFYCKSLLSITVPNSVKGMGENVFEGCSSLKEVNLSDSLTDINICCFNDCSSLEKVTMPKNLKSISPDAFNGCVSLKNIDIPQTVKIIWGRAFSNCTALTSVNITNIDAWGHIDFGAYYYTYDYDNLDSNPVYFAKHLYVNGEEIDNINIPSDVTRIGACAYCGIESLKKVNIHSNVERVYPYAFYGCKNMAEIYVHAVKPPQAEISCFEGIDKQSCTLYVPQGTDMDYFLAEGWGDFQNIVEFDATGINQVDLSCSPKSVDYYNVNGMKTTRATKGLNILKMSDGIYKKVSF